MSVFRLPRFLSPGVSCHTLAACSSPCRQRRLSRPCKGRVKLAALSVSGRSKSLALATVTTPDSYWLAPEGAKPMNVGPLQDEPALYSQRQTEIVGAFHLRGAYWTFSLWSDHWPRRLLRSKLAVSAGCGWVRSVLVCYGCFWRHHSGWRSLRALP